MTINEHPSYIYAVRVLSGEVNAPRYVKKQIKIFKAICDDENPDFFVDMAKVKKIDRLLRLMVVAKGMAAGQTMYKASTGYQWVIYIATLCIVRRDDAERRRYTTVILEICRKNYKTTTCAVLFILLLLTEPLFSKFYSVAPDGSLSREVRDAIEMIIKRSPALMPEAEPERIFKVRRDDIFCKLNQNDYVPLNYSNSRLDGKLPSAFIADEVGALPNSYAIEAMRSGQLGIKNKLGCVISTKYPKSQNAFEEEVAYAKKVLDGVVDDAGLFALLYEPDDTTDWMTDDGILEQANPAAVECPEMMDDIKKKRQRAIDVQSARENFVTKHCNIIFQGIGTESFIPVEDLRECRVDAIDLTGRDVYVGLDFAMTEDNVGVDILAEIDGEVFSVPMGFLPEGRIREKSMAERFDYTAAIERGECIACGENLGGKIIDYGVVEDYVFDIEKRYGCSVVGIGYDRYNAMSSAQRFERGRDGEEGYNTVIVRQHSDTLHMPTKLLYELIETKRFHYVENLLYEENFENARCTFDTNKNRYITKKRSTGKVDLVFATLDALYLLQQDVFLGGDMDWAIQTA